MQTRTRLGSYLCSLSVVLVAGACGNVPGDISTVRDTSTVTGTVLDTAGVPVDGAHAIVMSGDQQTSYSAVTDAHGTYALEDVPVALLLAPEATILFVSPLTDRVPMGTSEGDYVHEMPIAVREFVEPAALGVEPSVQARTAYVPLQAEGVPITDELIRDGGELTWQYADDGMRGDLTVTLRIAPGSIAVPAGSQAELTLTPVDYYKTPMRIPGGGAGALWTLQPRDIEFDPPAELIIEGERAKLLGSRAADVQVGDEVEIYGATPVEGWTKFGDATVAALADGRVTLASAGGIIHKGAWGHVFGAEGVNAGAEVTCYLGEDTPVPCRIVRSGSVAELQVDWSSAVPLDTDGEDLACWDCTNIGAPEAQGSVGLQIPFDGAPARVTVVYLATGETFDIELDAVAANSFRYDSVAHFTP